MYLEVWNYGVEEVWVVVVDEVVWFDVGWVGVLVGFGVLDVVYEVVGVGVWKGCFQKEEYQGCYFNFFYFIIFLLGRIMRVGGVNKFYFVVLVLGLYFGFLYCFIVNYGMQFLVLEYYGVIIGKL